MIKSNLIRFFNWLYPDVFKGIYKYGFNDGLAAYEAKIDDRLSEMFESGYKMAKHQLKHNYQFDTALVYMQGFEAGKRKDEDNV